MTGDSSGTVSEKSSAQKSVLSGCKSRFKTHFYAIILLIHLTAVPFFFSDDLGRVTVKQLPSSSSLSAVTVPP